MTTPNVPRFFAFFLCYVRIFVYFCRQKENNVLKKKKRIYFFAFLIAFVLILIGIFGIFFAPDTTSRLISVLVLILGIVAFYLAFASIAQPLYVAVIVGICLIMEGILFLGIALVVGVMTAMDIIEGGFNFFGIIWTRGLFCFDIALGAQQLGQ